MIHQSVCRALTKKTRQRSTVACKQEAGRMLVCLTDTDLPLSEERVHVVDICHELAVTKGEIGYIPARLGSCQHLEQGWRKRSLC